LPASLIFTAGTFVSFRHIYFFFVKETRVLVENHGQTLSHNVVSSTPHLSWIRTHNISSDRHRLHSIAQRGYIISFCQYIWRIMVPHLKEIWSDFIDLHCGEKQNQESAQILYRILIKSFMCPLRPQRLLACKLLFIFSKMIMFHNYCYLNQQ
jgi:hypothetical protein